MQFLRKLNQHGVAHHLALVVVVLAVAVGGTAYLVASHADTPKPVAANVNYTCSGSDKYQSKFVDNHGNPHPNVCMHKDGTLAQDEAVNNKNHCKSGLFLDGNYCYSLYAATAHYSCPGKLMLQGALCYSPVVTGPVTSPVTAPTKVTPPAPPTKVTPPTPINPPPTNPGGTTNSGSVSVNSSGAAVAGNSTGGAGTTTQSALQPKVSTHHSFFYYIAPWHWF